MRKVSPLLFIILIATSCLRLDDVAFVNTSLNEYLLDDYQGEKAIPDLPSEMDIPDSNITLLTFNSQGEQEAEGVTIYGVYIGDLNNINNDTIIVYCHGQSDHMDHYWNRAKLLANAGGNRNYAVLMMDYRGYGMSEGEPSEKGMYLDVASCLQWLKDMDVMEENVVLYGYSLGTIPSSQIAGYYGEYIVNKLILESTVSSAENISQESTLINTHAKYILDSDFDVVEAIKHVEQPFMWLHGTADDYLKISNGEIVYENYNGPYSEAHRIQGANHGQGGVPETMGYENYLNTVTAFIRK